MLSSDSPLLLSNMASCNLDESLLPTSGRTRRLGKHTRVKNPPLCTPWRSLGVKSSTTAGLRGCKYTELRLHVSHKHAAHFCKEPKLPIFDLTSRQTTFGGVGGCKSKRSPRFHAAAEQNKNNAGFFFLIPPFGDVIVNKAAHGFLCPVTPDIPPRWGPSAPETSPGCFQSTASHLLMLAWLRLAWRATISSWGGGVADITPPHTPLHCL